MKAIVIPFSFNFKVFLWITVVSPPCQFANDQFTNFEVDSPTSTSNIRSVFVRGPTSSICFKLLSSNLIYSSEGFPESVVAAALSRVGMKVLHLDR